jgi:hypothetical protein
MRLSVASSDPGQPADGAAISRRSPAQMTGRIGAQYGIDAPMLPPPRAVDKLSTVRKIPSPWL